MKLLLFDIDGTILLTQGGGRQAVEQALFVVFGQRFSSDGVSFSGKTDPQIMHELLLKNGLSESEAAASLPEALAAYVKEAGQHLLPEHVHILPGIRSLIAHLAVQPDVQLALLTGNLKITAYLKLKAVGLDQYFPFGAFGCDHADRYQLPRIAQQRALEHTGRTFSGKNIVIIGDTEHDICCGKSLGVFSVAVCTGHYDRAALSPHEPDLLFEDFDDHRPFLEAILPA